MQGLHEVTGRSLKGVRFKFTGAERCIGEVLGQRAVEGLYERYKTRMT